MLAGNMNPQGGLTNYLQPMPTAQASPFPQPGPFQNISGESEEDALYATLMDKIQRMTQQEPLNMENPAIKNAGRKESLWAGASSLGTALQAMAMAPSYQALQQVLGQTAPAVSGEMVKERELRQKEAVQDMLFNQGQEDRVTNKLMLQLETSRRQQEWKQKDTERRATIESAKQMATNAKELLQGALTSRAIDENQYKGMLQQITLGEQLSADGSVQGQGLISGILGKLVSTDSPGLKKTTAPEHIVRGRLIWRR